LIPERIQVEKAVWDGNRVKSKQERTEQR
jgi:hypothetical protein